MSAIPFLPFPILFSFFSLRLLGNVFRLENLLFRHQADILQVRSINVFDCHKLIKPFFLPPSLPPSIPPLFLPSLPYSLLFSFIQVSYRSDSDCVCVCESFYTRQFAGRWFLRLYRKKKKKKKGYCCCCDLLSVVCASCC